MLSVRHQIFRIKVHIIFSISLQWFYWFHFCDFKNNGVKGILGTNLSLLPFGENTAQAKASLDNCYLNSRQMVEEQFVSLNVIVQNQWYRWVTFKKIVLTNRNLKLQEKAGTSKIIKQIARFILYQHLLLRKLFLK